VLHFGVSSFTSHCIGKVDVFAVFIALVSSWPWLNFAVLLVDDTLLLIAAETPAAMFIMVNLKLTLDLIASWRWDFVVDAQYNLLAIAERRRSVCKPTLDIVELVAAG
jgi:hypothetical protein